MKNTAPSIRFNLSQIERLKKLNRVLRTRQNELWNTIDEEVPRVERQLVGKLSTFRHYELSFAIRYFIMKESRPIYTATAVVKIESRKEIAAQMNNPHFDWSIKGMPPLEEPYCFLLGQLFQQPNIATSIPDIAIVQTTIQFRNQDKVMVQNKKWTFVFREGNRERSQRTLLPKR